MARPSHPVPAPRVSALSKARPRVTEGLKGDGGTLPTAAPLVLPKVGGKPQAAPTKLPIPGGFYPSPPFFLCEELGEAGKHSGVTHGGTGNAVGLDGEECPRTGWGKGVLYLMWGWFRIWGNLERFWALGCHRGLASGLQYPKTPLWKGVGVKPFFQGGSGKGVR